MMPLFLAFILKDIFAPGKHFYGRCLFFYERRIDMIRKHVLFVLVTGSLLLLTCSISAASLTPSLSPVVSESEMPYRGIIIGSYWQEWPFYSLREFVEPNILFIGIVRHNGPMMTHYYRFEVHRFHKLDSSLFVETFKGTQHPHFLFGFCRFYTLDSYTHLRRFDGEFHGVVLRQPGTENIYYIVRLSVNGTGLYSTQTGFEQQALSEVLRPGHYIELRQFNGTRTSFYLSGIGMFFYYYMVPYGPHPWEDV